MCLQVLEKVKHENIVKLLAIEEEYVEGVEILLEMEARIWQRGTPHSWEVSQGLTD